MQRTVELETGIARTILLFAGNQASNISLSLEHGLDPERHGVVEVRGTRQNEAVVSLAIAPDDIRAFVFTLGPDPVDYEKVELQFTKVESGPHDSIEVTCHVEV